MLYAGESLDRALQKEKRRKGGGEVLKRFWWKITYNGRTSCERQHPQRRMGDPGLPSGKDRAAELVAELFGAM